MAVTPRYELAEVHFPSWDSFKLGYRAHLSNSKDASEAAFIFRGQGSAKWRLQTKFDRDMRGLGRATAELRRGLLNEFTKQLELADQLPDRSADRGPPSEAEVWAFGQHYQLPTPLLDWSLSPYVAAFFACETALQMVRVDSPQEAAALQDRLAIFALRRDEPFLAHWTRMGVTFVEDMNVKNRRIRPQLGLFSMLPEGAADLEEVLGGYCKANGMTAADFITKFTLSYGTAFQALRDLDLMDLNARRIYADLDGVSRAATLNYRLSILCKR